MQSHGRDGGLTSILKAEYKKVRLFQILHGGFKCLVGYDNQDRVTSSSHPGMGTNASRNVLFSELFCRNGF